MSFADEVSKNRGQPATVRIGVVASVAPLVVTVQATPLTNAGVLDGYIPVVGHTVALLGQSAVSADGSSWLVLGRVVTAASGVLSAVTVASGVDTTNVITTSAPFVPLTGLFNVGIAFVAPTSGRVLINLRAVMLMDVGTVGKASFRVGTGATIGAGTVIQAAGDATGISSFANTSSPEFGSQFLVSGLVAGDTYNVQMEHRRVSGAGNTIFGNRQVTVIPTA